MNIKLISALAATALLSAVPAFAAPVTFDFEDVTLGLPLDSVVKSGYTFSFGGDILGVVNDEVSQFFTQTPQTIGAISVVGADNSLNMVDPNTSFVGSVKLSYSSTAAATVTVWSGLNGTGTGQTFNLAANSAGCSDATPYCLWETATLGFTGFARSITFDTPFLAAFDDVQVNAVPVPAAAWLLGSALAGFGAWRRKRAAA